jgi:hypothetical protein
MTNAAGTCSVPNGTANRCKKTVAPTIATKLETVTLSTADKARRGWDLAPPTRLSAR